MEGYKPPFTITNSILSYVASISEKVGRITVMNNMENKSHLRRNNRKIMDNLQNLLKNCWVLWNMMCHIRAECLWKN